MVMINLQLTDIELNTLRTKLENKHLSSKDESILEDILMKIRTMNYTKVGVSK